VFLLFFRFTTAHLPPLFRCHFECESRLNYLLSYVQQEKNPDIKCFLVDPPGSGLFNKVTRGVMYTKEEAEGRRLKNPFDTITEGIGINRITKNFAMAKLNGAFRGTDREAVEIARLLLCCWHPSFLTFDIFCSFLLCVSTRKNDMK